MLVSFGSVADSISMRHLRARLLGLASCAGCAVDHVPLNELDVRQIRLGAERVLATAGDEHGMYL